MYANLNVHRAQVHLYGKLCVWISRPASTQHQTALACASLTVNGLVSASITATVTVRGAAAILKKMENEGHYNTDDILQSAIKYDLSAPNNLLWQKIVIVFFLRCKRLCLSDLANCFQ